MFDQRIGQPDGAEQIAGERGLRVAQITEFIERPFHAHDAGIVEQHVDSGIIDDQLFGGSRDAGGVVLIKSQRADIRPIPDRLFEGLQPPTRDDHGIAEVVEAVRERLAGPRRRR